MKSRTAFRVIAASAMLTAIGGGASACANPERGGEGGTSTSTQEYTPDISNLPPLRDFFRGSGLGEGVRLDTEAQEIDRATFARAEAAVEVELNRSITYAGAEFELILFGLVDNEGVKQKVLLAAVTNVPEGDLVPTITPSPDETEIQPPSALFFVTDTSTEGGGFFVPIGQGEEGSQARAIPLGSWFDEENVYIGFGQYGQPTLAIYKVDIEGDGFYYIDPYSQEEISLIEEDVPGVVAKALLSERPVYPIPPELENLPEGFFAYRYDDDSWGIGTEGEDEEIIPIPGVALDQNKLKLDIRGEAFYVTPSQIRFDEEKGIIRFYEEGGDLAAEYNLGEEYLVDVRALHDFCYYGRDEINSFSIISRRSILINEENLEVIVGINEEGEEKILAGEMTTYTNEKVWTRISIADLGGDNGQMIMWLNPDQDGAIQVNDATAPNFRDRFFVVITDGEQGASIDNMTDGDITLKVPYAKHAYGGPDIRWVEETLDLNNIEIRIIQSPEEWQEFARDYPDYAMLVFSSGLGRSGVGACIMPKVGGGSLLVVPYLQWSSSYGEVWSGQKPEWLISGVDALRNALAVNDFGPWFFQPLSTFANRPAGNLAFMTVYEIDPEYPIDEVKTAFDYITEGFIENHDALSP